MIVVVFDVGTVVTVVIVVAAAVIVGGSSGNGRGASSSSPSSFCSCSCCAFVSAFGFVFTVWFLTDLARVKAIKPAKETPIPAADCTETGMANRRLVQTMAKILRVQLRAAWWTTLIRVSR